MSSVFAFKLWLDTAAYGTIALVSAVVFFAGCGSPQSPPSRENLSAFDQGVIAGRAGISRDLNPWPNVPFQKRSGWEPNLGPNHDDWNAGHVIGTAERGCNK